MFEDVRARVESGDYLDERVGFPGVDTEGGGTFRHTRDGRLQRLYWRGSPEYLAAHAAGQFEPLPPLTPASEDEVNECEASLGRPLPSLLRRSYLRLGDGGFGPAYGLIPLEGILSRYRGQQQHWTGPWEARAGSLLPICDWGCGITSYVDVADPAAGMWAIDPNPAPADDFHVALFPQHMSLATWMRSWLEGTLLQPWLFQDQDTGEWRGATNAEIAAAMDQDLE